MDWPCPNCGNRQHAPGANICRVCGQPLRSVFDSSNSEPCPNNAPQLQASREQNLPASLKPCLLDQEGRQYSISLNGDNFIGSIPSVDILCIQGPGIQPRHARIYSVEQQMFLEAMVGCLVLVNGRATGRTAHILRDRDMITFGSTRVLMYQVNGPIRQQTQGDRISFSNNYSTDDSQISNVQVPPSHSAPMGCDLYGRVRHVDGPYMEDPDPTLGRALAKAAGFALAMWKPAMILLQKPHQQVPVRYLRIEMLDGQVRMVKMKGNLVTGTLHTGDMCLFWGEWQSGTLLMHRGHNETTQSDVFLRQ